jgi:hypothetical protein
MGEIPLPRAVDGDIEQAGCPRRQRRQVSGHLRREPPLPNRKGWGAAEHRRCRFWQAIEPQRLDLGQPVEANDADLRKGRARIKPHRHGASTPGFGAAGAVRSRSVLSEHGYRDVVAAAQPGREGHH